MQASRGHKTWVNSEGRMTLPRDDMDDDDDDDDE
jgi:hypothetical protein